MNIKMNVMPITKFSMMGIVLTLVLSLMLPSVVYAKKMVERPLQGKGEGITDLSTGMTKEVGVQSHGGRFINEGRMWPDPNNVGVNLGAGTMTMANGDQLFWVAATHLTSPIIPGEEVTIEGTIIITGGTGRFENASGELNLNTRGIWPTDGPYMKYTFTVEGTIIY